VYSWSCSLGLGVCALGLVGLHGGGALRVYCAVTDLVLHVARSSCLLQLPFALYDAGSFMHVVHRRLCACVGKPMRKCRTARTAFSIQHLVGFGSVCYLQEAGHYYMLLDKAGLGLCLARLVSTRLLCVLHVRQVQRQAGLVRSDMQACLHHLCGLRVGFFWVCLPQTPCHLHVRIDCVYDQLSALLLHSSQCWL
jgi:hypothetical protein